MQELSTFVCLRPQTLKPTVNSGPPELSVLFSGSRVARDPTSLEPATLMPETENSTISIPNSEA